MLRPTHGVQDGRDLFHVAIFAHGREQIGRFEELIARDTGDAFDYLGGVARILLLQKLENAAGMLQGEIIGHLLRQLGGGSSRTGTLSTLLARALIALSCEARAGL